MERDFCMWTCIKCTAVNEDIYTICPKCGASRSAGRFGSASTAKAPVYSPPIESKPAEKAPSPAATAAAPAAHVYIPQPDKVRAGGGMRFLGRVLAMLLPLIVAFFAYLKFNAYTLQLSILVYGSVLKPLPIPIIVLYVLLALSAALLASLPGLWTLSVGKLLLRFARMEELL